ncbi:MAG TPA: hypothetical protein VHT03_07235 [Rhizomicrobium sp.]|jgi:hypothetical protein|nr:hypothetical protein [Rhizomicrobium sp.]
MQAVPETPAVTSAPAAVPAGDAHCTAIARQRAEDTAAAGLDRETQEIVRRGAYADCLAWSTAHPASP